MPDMFPVQAVKENYSFSSSILLYQLGDNSPAPGSCKQLWGLKNPEAEFSHPFDHSRLSHTNYFSMYVVPALTQPQRCQRRNGKREATPQPTQGKKKLGGTRRHLFDFAGLPVHKKGGSKTSFSMTSASYLHNLANSEAQTENKSLTLPQLHRLLSPGYIPGIAKCQISSTEYNGTVACINPFSTS